MGITIKKSNCADTRTCDWSKVTVEQLEQQSWQHINDVRAGMEMLATMLLEAGRRHDHTKIERIAEFFADFKTGFKQTDWWIGHQKDERHHFNNAEYVRDDVNLIDVLEQIVDGVMAGLARSGKYRCEPPSSELLQKAYENTAKLLLSHTSVVPADSFCQSEGLEKEANMAIETLSGVH